MENNNNNIVAKPMYKCGICGKIYDTIEDRMKCEQKCLINEKEKKEKEKAELKRKERESDNKMIQDEIYNLSNMLTNYKQKYGVEFSLNYDYKNHNSYNALPTWFELWY